MVKEKSHSEAPRCLFSCIHKSHFYTQRPIMIGFQLSLFFNLALKIKQIWFLHSPDQR